VSDLHLLEGSGLDPALEQGADVIARAYPPGAVRMDAAFLRWALTARAASLPAPLAVLAVDAGRPVGFAAAIPLALDLHGDTTPAQLVTAVAVAPDARGAGLGRALYDALLPALAARHVDAVVITFAEAGSAGARRIAERYPAHHWHGAALAPRRVWGAVRRRLAAVSPPDSAPAAPTVATIVPDAGTAAWLQSDPRSVAALGTAGRVMLLPLLGDGARAIAAVDLFVAPGTPAALVEALQEGAGHLPDDVVQLTCTSLDAEHDALATAAGLRRLPAPDWQPWCWCRRADHPLLRARSTTIPVT
jgi:GNAT superfamily N-acetyltransferase